MSAADRLAELEAALQRSKDPREQEHLEVEIAELAQEIADPTLPPADSRQWDVWALQGEDRMLATMGWGRDDC